MSTRRNARCPDDRRGPNGERLCCWCGGSLPKGRRRWCGDPCVEAFRIRAWSDYARQRVFARDAGVCALCGIDAHRLAYGIGPAPKPEIQHRGRTDTGGATLIRETWLPRLSPAKLRLLCRTHGLRPAPAVATWEADHITPVVEGGGEADLSNLRTLCWLCHRGETAALVKRRASRRRQEKAQASGQVDMWGETK